MATNKINCVVVGYGRAGRDFHCFLIHHINELKLYGVVSRSEKHSQICQEQGSEVKTFSTLDDALKDSEVDVLVIATPTQQHFHDAKLSLSAGKHVVVDKPLCVSELEATELQKLSKERNLMLTSFQNRRWDSEFLTVMKLKKGRRLGDIRWTEFCWQIQTLGHKPWKHGSYRSGGGRFWDLGIHLLDQLLILYAPAKPISVYSRMHKDYPDHPHTDSHFLAVLQFDTGATGTIDTSSRVFIQEKPRYLIHGSEGSFVKMGIDLQESVLGTDQFATIRDVPENYGRLKVVDQENPILIESEKGDWLQFYRIVAQALSGGEPHGHKQFNPSVDGFVTIESLVNLIRVMEACFLSAETNQVIKLN